MNKRLIIVLALLVVVSGGYFGYRHWYPEVTTNGPITVYGNVDIRELNLAFRIPGRVEEVRVEEGEAVAAGNLLAVVDREPYEAQVASARARLEGAEAELARLEHGFRAEEIAQARAQQTQRQAAFNKARRELEREQNLASSGAGTERSLDLALAAFEEAEAALAVAGANLSLLESGYRWEEVAVAQARVKEAQAEVRRLEIQLNDTRLVTPSDGIVLVRAVEPGSMVNSAQTVLTLTLPDRTWVRAYISQTHLGKIYPGMRAEVYTDSRPQEPYLGHIGFISSRAEFTPKNVETEDLRTDLVFRFRVILDETDEGLRQGMPVTVKLLNAEEESREY